MGTVDISILRRMELARLNLIVFCFILMTHFQGHKRFFVNADAEPRIKHRQFISKARSDYIKQRFQGGFQGESQQSQNIVAKVESARVDPIKIPLCAYVEEKIEEVAEPQVNQTENKAFLDPQLGSVVTLEEFQVLKSIWFPNSKQSLFLLTKLLF